MKATHNGHCQLCGALQAVSASGSLMAKHGYSVKWNMFLGVCRGAGAKPFQLATDLIEAAIAEAKKEAAGLRERAAAERLKGGSKTMVHVYLPATWKDRQSRHEWQEVEVSEQVRTLSSGSSWSSFSAQVVSRDQNGKPQPKAQSLDAIGLRSMEAVVAAGRKAYAESLEKQAERFDKYAAWQESRVAAWKPEELLPRK